MALIVYFGSVVLISLSGVMAPGPITALTLARGRKEPFAGFWINVGHSAVELPFILALYAGMAPLLRLPGFQRGVSILGGLVLLWLGWGLLRPAAKFEGAAQRENLWNSHILAGVALTLFNPYWFIWWFTIGAGLVARARAFDAFAVAALMGTLHVSCDLVWGTFLSWTAHRSERVFHQKGWRRIELGCGAGLILFGGIFLYQGLWGA